MRVLVGGLILIAAGLVAFMFFSEDDLSPEEEAFPNTNVSIEAPSKKNDISQNSKDDDPEWQGLDKEKAREVMRDEGMPVGASSYTGPRPLTEKEMDKMDETFEAYEKGWDNKMKNLFIDELGLTQEDYGDYEKMRDGFEEDRLEAFEEFHKKMAMERGPHYSYSPTQEMIDFDSKLKREYLDFFRKRYGEEAYARYQNALDEYNTKIRSEADPKYGVLTIEF